MERNIREDTEPRLFYELLHYGRLLKSRGWSKTTMRCFLAGVLIVYIRQNEDFRMADRMREIHKILASGVDY